MAVDVKALIDSATAPVRLTVYQKHCLYLDKVGRASRNHLRVLERAGFIKFKSNREYEYTPLGMRAINGL